MIYTGLNRTGEIETVKAHGGADVAEVYGGINESNPIYYKTRTLTGTSPLSYKALSKPLSDYLISGNTVQDGTPTPSDPVDVVGCVARTSQLLNKDNFIDGGNFYPDVFSMSMKVSVNTDILLIPCKANTTYTVSRSTLITHRFAMCFITTDQIVEGLTFTGYRASSDFSDLFLSSTSADDSRFLCIYYAKHAGSDSSTPEEIQQQLSEIMVNGGPMALPYEPYGYKIPISSGGVTTNIYLGSTQTTRQIKKLVLTGEEPWTKLTSAPQASFQLPATAASRTVFSTHYEGVIEANTGAWINAALNRLFIQDRAHVTDITVFKQFLADQYTNGTPVCVWYALATPETGIVNEPLHKIGDYADTISMEQAGVTIPTVAGANTLTVDTTVQPSAVSITGNIKEVSR